LFLSPFLKAELFKEPRNAEKSCFKFFPEPFPQEIRLFQKAKVCV